MLCFGMLFYDDFVVGLCVRGVAGCVGLIWRVFCYVWVFVEVGSLIHFYEVW
jgi:hypothetical protein